MKPKCFSRLCLFSTLPYSSVTTSTNSDPHGVFFRTKYWTNISFWSLWGCYGVLASPLNPTNFCLHPHLLHPRSWQFWCCLKLRIHLPSNLACVFLFGKVAEYWQLFIIDLLGQNHIEGRSFHMTSLLWKHPFLLLLIIILSPSDSFKVNSPFTSLS